MGDATQSESSSNNLVTEEPIYGLSTTAVQTAEGSARHGKRTVTVFGGVIVASCAYLGFVRLPERFGEPSTRELTLATIALGALSGAWLSRSLWARDWGPSALSGLAGASVGFFLLGMSLLGANAIILSAILGCFALGLSILPWVRLRRIIHARAGQVDSGGYIRFLDGTSGRADGPVRAGDVLAWPSRESRPADYRHDGTPRFRALAGTRQGHVEAHRRESSVGMVAMLGTILLVCSIVAAVSPTVPANERSPRTDSEAERTARSIVPEHVHDTPTGAPDALDIVRTKVPQPVSKRRMLHFSNHEADQR